MNRLLLLPDIGGNNARHWQNLWLQAIPGASRLPGGDWLLSSDLKLWVHAIEEAVKGLQSPLIVAHGFGCLAAITAFQDQPHRIRGALLVAPFNPEFLPVRESWQFRRSIAFKARLLASRNDPLLPFNTAVRLSENWKVPLKDVGNVGHLDTRSAIGNWDEGLLALRYFNEEIGGFEKESRCRGYLQ